jgi:hypothetical protein
MVRFNSETMTGVVLKIRRESGLSGYVGAISEYWCQGVDLLWGILI